MKSIKVLVLILGSIVLLPSASFADRVSGNSQETHQESSVYHNGRMVKSSTRQRILNSRKSGRYSNNGNGNFQSINMKTSTVGNGGVNVRTTTVDDGVNVRTTTSGDGVNVHTSTSGDGVNIRTTTSGDGVNVRTTTVGSGGVQIKTIIRDAMGGNYDD
jgi:hypothetical protein